MRIGIHGAIHIQNFGDVLLAAACAKWIRDRLPDADICFPWASEGVRSELHLFSRHSQDDKGGVDLMIFCGGGYLHDSGSLRRRVLRPYQLFARPLLRLFRCKKYAVIGLGVGPLRTFSGKLIGRRFLAHADLVSVRDEESMAWLTSAGCDRKNVFLTADSAIAYTRSLFPSFPELKETGRTLLLHLISSDAAVHTGLYEYLLENGFLYDKIKLVSDQKGNRSPVDVSKLQALVRARIEEIPYQGYHRVLQEIATSDDVLTNKYHLGIVAATLGRRVMAIPSNFQKVVRFYQQIDAAGHCFDSIELSSAKVAQGMKKFFAEGNSLTVPESVINASWKNKELIDGWLNSGPDIG